MNIEINDQKARWTEKGKRGRWQEIKEDKQGHFIRKGLEKVYITIPEPEKNEPESLEESKKSVNFDELDAMFFIDAYWLTKPFWDKKHGSEAPRDYYFYRSNLNQYEKSFYLNHRP